MKIILIGMMGAGKSSIGKNLAEKTSARFIDVDEYIQHKYNSTISQIFENEGEDYFRQIEAKTFSEVINNNENIIISTGGGTPLNNNCHHIFTENEVIFLDAFPDILFERATRRKNDRPLMKPLDYKKFEQLYIDRRKIYSSFSNLTVDTSNIEIRDVVKKIMVHYEL
jgi:shikimate kinase